MWIYFLFVCFLSKFIEDAHFSLFTAPADLCEILFLITCYLLQPLRLIACVFFMTEHGQKN